MWGSCLSFVADGKIRETLNAAFLNQVRMACARKAQTHISVFSSDRECLRRGFVCSLDILINTLIPSFAKSSDKFCFY